MKPPIFVRFVTDSERDALFAGLRSPDAFTLRRCQILLASARQERAVRIAAALGCDDQSVRNAIHAFNQRGLDALSEGSSRPHRIAAAFDAPAAQRLRALVHQSPRTFDKPTSLWTLDLLAEVCVSEGITDERVTGETIRVTLKRLGLRWQRAKGWITSPDPAYARKKVARPADPFGNDPSRLGARFRGRGLVEQNRAFPLGELGGRRHPAALGRADGDAPRSRSEGARLLWPVGAAVGRQGAAGRAAVAAFRGRTPDQRGGPLGRTTQFLAWCCDRLAAQGKTALLPGALWAAWDNASWHVSKAVRTWIRQHNRAVKGEEAAVRIIVCPLPSKSPWLNPIEPQWMHGKRKIVEPARLLTADEIATRVCACFGCRHEPHLHSEEVS